MSIVGAVTTVSGREFQTALRICALSVMKEKNLKSCKISFEVVIWTCLTVIDLCFGHLDSATV